MLTGDKLETAESIGFSSQLLTEDMELIRVRTLADVRYTFTREKATYKTFLRKRSLLIEASALKGILGDQETRRWFLPIAKSMETVICCRVSPSQKAEVVKMVKRDDP